MKNIKLSLLLLTAVFALHSFSATAMSDTPAETMKKTSKRKRSQSPEKRATQAGSLDDYEAFKTAEQVREIVHESIDTVSKDVAFQESPHFYISKGSTFGDLADIETVGDMELPQIRKGLMTNGFEDLYTQWGTKNLMHQHCNQLIRNLVQKEIQKRITIGLYYNDADYRCDHIFNGNKLYKILAIDGRDLPEPIADVAEFSDDGLLPDSEYSDDSVVKTALKKHHERYQKEKTDAITPFIPVQAVAEIVTAYLYH